MYWEEAGECVNVMVSESIRRDTFDAVLQLTHFVDNDQLDKDDRFAKVRPIFTDLYFSSQKYLPEKAEVSVDEIMIPYFDPHGDKQHIR